MLHRCHLGEYNSDIFLKNDRPKEKPKCYSQLLFKSWLNHGCSNCGLELEWIASAFQCLIQFMEEEAQPCMKLITLNQWATTRWGRGKLQYGPWTFSNLEATKESRECQHHRQHFKDPSFRAMVLNLPNSVAGPLTSCHGDPSHEIILIATSQL